MIYFVQYVFCIIKEHTFINKTTACTVTLPSCIVFHMTQVLTTISYLYGLYSTGDVGVNGYGTLVANMGDSNLVRCYAIKSLQLI